MKRRGFTLIELLVVIAIIALLISMLVPALSAAKENANISKCLSNLKTIATTSSMYIDDHDRATLPWHLSFQYNNVQVNLISEFIYGGFQTTIPSPDFGENTDMYQYATEWRPFNKYIAPGRAGRGLVKSYICPSDKNNTTPLVGSTTPPVVEDRFGSFEVNGNSYPINWYWYEDPIFDNFDGHGRNYGRLDWMSSAGSWMISKKVGGLASEWVAFMENTMNSYMLNATPPDGSEGESPLQVLGVGWHRKYSKYSIGFLDGHADYKFIDTRFTRGPGWNIRPGQ